MTRKLYEIANEIERTWAKVNFAARPYLSAMKEINDINDTYGADTAKSVVAYFLCNANSWHGDDARRIKSELRAL